MIEVEFESWSFLLSEDLEPDFWFLLIIPCGPIVLRKKTGDACIQFPYLPKNHQNTCWAFQSVGARASPQTQNLQSGIIFWFSVVQRLFLLAPLVSRQIQTIRHCLKAAAVDHLKSWQCHIFKQHFFLTICNLY